MKRWEDGFIAVDWGTTNRRAYRIDGQGSCAEEFEDDRGVLDGIAEVVAVNQGNAVFRNYLGRLLATAAIPSGGNGGPPAVGDFDGDGRTDPAVYRAGIWHIYGSATGYSQFQFGHATDIPVPADYDGDGKADGPRQPPARAPANALPRPAPGAPGRCRPHAGPRA